eukprot:jgi/Chlat1/5499/Chrsp360S00833
MAAGAAAGLAVSGCSLPSALLSSSPSPRIRRHGCTGSSSRRTGSSSTSSSSSTGLRLVGSTRLHVRQRHRRRRHSHGFVVSPVCGDIAGEYGDTFADVDKTLVDYFTFKALKTVLSQLSETDPPKYMWLYQFSASNKPHDSKYFLRQVIQEQQELGERIMVTRLNLYDKWIVAHDYLDTRQRLQDSNLEILRERLTQTIAFMPDDVAVDASSNKKQPPSASSDA